MFNVIPTTRLTFNQSATANQIQDPPFPIMLKPPPTKVAGKDVGKSAGGVADQVERGANRRGGEGEGACLNLGDQNVRG